MVYIKLGLDYEILNLCLIEFILFCDILGLANCIVFWLLI